VKGVHTIYSAPELRGTKSRIDKGQAAQDIQDGEYESLGDRLPINGLINPVLFLVLISIMTRWVRRCRASI